MNFPVCRTFPSAQDAALFGAELLACGYQVKLRSRGRLFGILFKDGPLSPAFLGSSEHLFLSLL